MAKPELKDPGSSALESPNADYDDHPVIQDKNKVDTLRMAGMSAPEAHEKVKGPVDLGDPESKADLAKTLGRTQQDGGRKAVYVDKDAEHLSLLAKDEEMEEKVTKNDLRTTQGKEVPDALEEPEKVDKNEEYDYNEDVAYLQKFGRA